MLKCFVWLIILLVLIVGVLADGNLTMPSQNPASLGLTTSTQGNPPVSQPQTTYTPVPTNPNAVLQVAVDARVGEANKFLAAEVSREINAAADNVAKKVNDNNDDNMRALDGRVNQWMIAINQKIILGMLGAGLLAQAIIALVVLRLNRKYSYEYYQHNMIKGLKSENVNLAAENKAFSEMQQRELNIQPPQPTIGLKYGQAEVGNMSMMNQWQGIPAREGAWAAPVQRQEQVRPAQTQYEQFQEQYPQYQDPQRQPSQQQQFGR